MDEAEVVPRRIVRAAVEVHVDAPGSQWCERRRGVIDGDENVGARAAVVIQRSQAAEDDLVAVVPVDIAQGDVGDRRDLQSDALLEALDEARVQLAVTCGPIVQHDVPAGHVRVAGVARGLVEQDDELERVVVVDVPCTQDQVHRRVGQVGVEDPLRVRLDRVVSHVVAHEVQEVR